jgi:hypothetical protein
MIRTDEPNIGGTGMHLSQNISLAVLLFAAGLWLYIRHASPTRKS